MRKSICLFALLMMIPLGMISAQEMMETPAVNVSDQLSLDGGNVRKLL